PDHAAHLSVRHVAADERHILHARYADIGNEHAVAEQMAGILLAQHARSDPTVGGRGNGHVRLPQVATFTLNLPCGWPGHKCWEWLLKMRQGCRNGLWITRSEPHRGNGGFGSPRGRMPSIVCYTKRAMNLDAAQHRSGKG